MGIDKKAVKQWVRGASSFTVASMMRSNSRSCPLACYLKWVFPEKDVSVGNLTYTLESWKPYTNPYWAQQFVQGVDAGKGTITRQELLGLLENI